MTIPAPQDVRDYLDGYGLPSSNDVISDAWIINRINNFIIPLIEKATKLKFDDGNTQYTDYLSGTGSAILTLNRRPIKDLISIKLIQSNSFYWAVSLSSIEVIHDKGMLKAKSLVEDTSLQSWVFPRGNRNIKVVYTAGFDSSNLPSDLHEMILYMAVDQVLMILASRTGGGNVPNKTFGNRGRYTEIRNDLARQIHYILSQYADGVING